MNPYSPLIIGGIGGSGTRIVGQLVKDAGIYLGDNINRANDAREFNDFFSNWIIPYYQKKNSFHEIKKDRINEFQKCVERQLLPIHGKKIRWGFKYTRSILLLPFLYCQFPKMQFIHVIRDGRDMIFSENQKQVSDFGKIILNKENPTKIQDKLRFWSLVNFEANKYGEEKLKENYLFVKFEDLCLKKEETIIKMFDFLDISVENLAPFLEKVNPPETMSRWKQHEDKFSNIPDFDKMVLKKFNYS